ncbi:hypothetical protein HAX54_047753 [Datura stramonium]|uniref:Uncharacterized protein n=1 Tax=Datura stramonium TaxID=4076 RepID=A0ABS8WNB0_DATST|nr:hypothetical protein [Datura stramonium]
MPKGYIYSTENESSLLLGLGFGFWTSQLPDSYQRHALHREGLAPCRGAPCGPKIYFILFEVLQSRWCGAYHGALAPCHGLHSAQADWVVQFVVVTHDMEPIVEQLVCVADPNTHFFPDFHLLKFSPLDTELKEVVNLRVAEIKMVRDTEPTWRCTGIGTGMECLLRGMEANAEIQLRATGLSRTFTGMWHILKIQASWHGA